MVHSFDRASCGWCARQRRRERERERDFFSFLFFCVCVKERERAFKIISVLFDYSYEKKSKKRTRVVLHKRRNGKLHPTFDPTLRAHRGEIRGGIHHVCSDGIVAIFRKRNAHPGRFRQSRGLSRRNVPDVAVEKKQRSRNEEEIFTGRETILSDEERAVQKTRESDGGVLRERSRA